MSEPRTFKLTTPHMTGDDIATWQEFLRERFDGWDIDYPLAADGDYGQATRSATASFMRAWGVKSAEEAMSDGLTPWWRTKLRDERRTDEEKTAFESDERTDYRRALRERHDSAGVASPLTKVIADSWGYHPGVHDGLDLICGPNAALIAICDGEIVRVSDDWWGLGSPGGALADRGDGIIVLRCGITAGPFRPGLNFGYGHAEHPKVKVGQKVRAGQVIGEAGFANAWHVHLVVNGRSDTKGVGDRDPRPFYDFARRA